MIIFLQFFKMKCDRCKLIKPDDSFKSTKLNKHKNNNILKTCIDCRIQISANNKRRNNENRNEIIKTNQESAIAPKGLVDFIFNALPEDYDSEYLFEKRIL